MNKSVVAFLLLGLSACAGKLEYTPPIGNGNVVTQISVDKSKTELWDSVIASLSKDFFVINNIEKDSGFINVSYSGAPSSFIDCGEISSYVKNAAGERTYRFGGEKENQIYELMTDGLYFIDRNMKLEGRINLVVREDSASASTLTANVLYTVTRTVRIRSAAGGQGAFSDSVTFNSKGVGMFPSPSSGREGLRCVPTGALERRLLQAGLPPLDSVRLVPPLPSAQ